MTETKRIMIFAFLMFTSACSNIGEDGYFFGAPILGPGFHSDSTSRTSSSSGNIVVKKGDTLYSLARTNDVPLRDMIEENNLRAPYILSLGQELKLPHRKYHMVEKGDTLYNISKRYDVDVTSLSRANNLQDPYIISIGDKLSIPGSVAYAPDEEQVSVAVTETNAAPSATKSVAPKAKARAKGKSTSKRPVAKATRPVTRAVATPARTAQATRKNTRLAWPVKGKIITPFGVAGKGKKNDGINIASNQGTRVSASENGVVVYAGNELKGFGNLVLVKHSRGVITAYAHNHKLYVRKGEVIKKGQQIAAVGQTGGVHSPQLHFEVHINKKPVNPVLYLP